MTKNDLAPEEVDFIKANYLQMSIIEMAETINTNFSKVRNCIKEHKLEVDHRSIKDFWNHNLNPITMYRINH
jgi:hypothetical protein